MYQHLLVPIDGSTLSIQTAEQAVALAKSTGGRVTFFHARPDFGATGDGALLHAAQPDSFVQMAAGNARALLAKAESSARAAKVEAHSIAVVSDHPHEAILAAAKTQGCDLIFMASHGRRGLKGALQGSVTQKVLYAATLPVLIASVESNLPHSDEQRALLTIKDEHRSLAAVLHGLEHVVGQIRSSALSPDFGVLRAMLYYIEKFPERLHHPKEEAFLFQRLRARTDECNAVLAELEQQHREGAQLFAVLGQALDAFEAEHDGAAERFFSAVERFAASQWLHLGAEEKVILPAAHRYLTNADWQAIAHAFLDNGDPRFGAQAEAAFADLFTRLLNLLPLENQ
ncbi:MAG: universal stress protein [Giesbergeria sp.]|uniref:universal stress protein n=1 Tax=Giesbergeria sp. TaxID=2818473 RepID=UPI00261E282A|nr:universal stress protein [Giesbergeria sp.]MDD2610227.1 universal stress protein [Giesbergeria sp.]